MFKVYKKDTRDVFLASSLLTLNIFDFFSNVSIVDFTLVNVCWVNSNYKHIQHDIQHINLVLCHLPLSIHLANIKNQVGVF